MGEAELVEFNGETDHLHAVPGDHAAETREVCRHLGIRCDGLGSAASAAA